MSRTPFLPLSARERRALSLWGTLLTLLGVLDYRERNNGTLSEAGRTVRRRLCSNSRLGPWPWRVVWGSFAFWFLIHTEGGDEPDAAASLSDRDPHTHG